MTSIPQLYELFKQHPKVTTDSREVPPDSLFFALKGERFDGNAFAQSALEKGAAYAVIDDPEHKKDDRYLLVDDALRTLQELATHHRRQFHIPILAITGSNGKTTTKELVSRVLASRYPTHWTQGNLNNHIGVPLTLLRMPLHTEIAVVEMGANHQGEIDFMCKIAEPSHGLITNIGKAHLEGFGGIEGVKKGKSELYRHLGRTGGMAFVNGSERFLPQLAESVSKKLFYQRSPSSSLQDPYDVYLLEEQPCVKALFLSGHNVPREVNTQLSGVYNFSNVMTAIAVGKYFKVPALRIKEAIESYVPENMRSQLLQHGSNTILLDAYNANPTSMRFAIENFARYHAKKRLAIVGDMLELGEDSQLEHQDIVALLEEHKIDQVLLVGPEFGKTKHQFQHVEDTAAAKSWFAKQQPEETHILIKGSRGMKLETILEK